MIKHLFFFLALALSGTAAFAQEVYDADSAKENPSKLNEVIVYANKFAETPRTVSQYVKSITNKTALNMQPNTADVLLQSGNVFVQKSQQGGGSPVIRGFEASRVLLMVDGVRMNNAIYRTGHLQNVISVDNMVLDRVEILYGPSSTLYGSDALGGVVNMYTRKPGLSAGGKTTLKGSTSFRYGTANNETRGNVLLNIGSRRFASLTSVTLGSFDDLVQGNNRMDKYPDFGKKLFIAQRINNKDTAVANPDPNKQVASGYKQVDVLQKFLYQASSQISHSVNLQFSNTNDIPRYDRLSENNNGTPVYAEWYYGPQRRNMIAYQLRASRLDGFFRDVAVTASYQYIEESRISRRFNNNNKDFRWEQVQVFGVTADAKHYDEKNELHIGAETYNNFVRSTAERRNILTNAVSRIATRYSDGPTTMSSNAVYAQHTLKINDRLTLNDGLRLNFVQLDAVFADTALMHFPFKTATQNNLAVTGNLGLIYATPGNLRLAAVLSSGFRSPNVDDLAKVFDSQTGTVIVPNPDLEPEYTYNAEINFNKYGERFSFGGAVFYTWFRNAIVTDKYTFNGEDSILYNGVKSEVRANQNKAAAWLYGFSVNAAFNITTQLTAEATYTYTYGRFSNADGSEVPLDHIPPAFGRITLKHNAKRWNAEIFSLFNGWKHIEDYNPYGEDNPQYATPDGMPSWITLNIKAAVNLNTNSMLQLTAENLFDTNYRYFASGISAPGRNLILSLKVGF